MNPVDRIPIRGVRRSPDAVLVDTTVAIVAAKRAGQDCTENESAVLKRFLRKWPDSALAKEVRHLFPLESDEQLMEPYSLGGGF